MGAGLDTQTPARSPSPLPKPRKHRSQPRRSDPALNYVMLVYARRPQTRSTCGSAASMRKSGWPVTRSVVTWSVMSDN